MSEKIEPRLGDEIPDNWVKSAEKELKSKIRTVVLDNFKGKENVEIFIHQSTTGIDSITGVGFKPHQLINFTCVNTSYDDNMQFHTPQIGVSDGITEGSVYSYVQDNVDISNAASYSYQDFIYMADSTSGVLFSVNVDSFNNDGFNLNYSNVHTTGYNAVALAFGQSEKLLKVGSYKYLVIKKI